MSIQFRHPGFCVDRMCHENGPIFVGRQHKVSN